MKKFLSLLLTTAMLCTLLAGCGSKNGNSDGGYTPVNEVQGVSDDTILVGNTAATTGAYATVGTPFNAGMEAAFKAYNDAGGFQGKNIVLKHYDDGFDGAQGMTYTKQLVETDKVFAITGHFGTNTVGATLDYLKEKGVPMIYAATGIDDLYQEAATGNDAVIYPVQPIFSAEVPADAAAHLQRGTLAAGRAAAQMGEHSAQKDGRAKQASGADIAVSLTGLAGPDGGTEQLPLGTVYVGAAMGNRVWVKHLTLGYRGREIVRQRSAAQALDMVRRLALGLEIPEARCFAADTPAQEQVF